MPWLDLEVGVLEEFADAHSRFLDPTAIEARVVEARLACRRDRKARWRNKQPKRARSARHEVPCAQQKTKIRECRRRWRERNPEKHAASVRVAVRAHYARNREAYKVKNRLAYLRRIGKAAA